MATKKRPAPKSKKPSKKSAPAPKTKAAPTKAAKAAKAAAKPAKASKSKAAKPAKKSAAKKPSDDAQLALRGNGVKAVKPAAPKQQPASTEPLEQSEASVDLMKLAKSAALKRLLRN